MYGHVWIVCVRDRALPRAVHSRGAGGQLPPPAKLNLFFFSNIVFDFAGLFLGATLVRNLYTGKPCVRSLPPQIKNPRYGLVA